VVVLSGVDLFVVDPSEADLSVAVLSGADPSGADLSAAPPFAVCCLEDLPNCYLSSRFRLFLRLHQKPHHNLSYH